MLSRRLRQRLFLHHAPLFAASALASILLYITRPYKDVLSKLSFATAYPALVLLVLTLLIGPWNLIRGKRNPISSDLRRDAGIWAGILGIIHAVVGQCVHLRGRPWLYYIYGANEKQSFPIRHDLFGVANYTGLLATLFLIVLFATSNDYSLRRLGTPRWKQWQRWNYLVFMFTGIHAVGYQLIEKQKSPFVITIVICFLAAITLQATGYALRRQAAKRHRLA